MTKAMLVSYWKHLNALAQHTCNFLGQIRNGTRERKRERLKTVPKKTYRKHQALNLQALN